MAKTIQKNYLDQAKKWFSLHKQLSIIIAVVGIFTLLTGFAYYAYVTMPNDSIAQAGSLGYGNTTYGDCTYGDDNCPTDPNTELTKISSTVCTPEVQSSNDDINCVITTSSEIVFPNSTDTLVVLVDNKDATYESCVKSTTNPLVWNCNNVNVGSEEGNKNVLLGVHNTSTPLTSKPNGYPDYNTNNFVIKDTVKVSNTESDNDGDGIPDILECPTYLTDRTQCPDTDGDGVPDYLDSDSDGDGIPDILEKGNTCLTAANCVLADTDGDGVPDYRDGDSDNDGIPDSIERGATCATEANCVLADSDGDGIPDVREVDSDNDGVWDLIEGNDANKDGVNDAGLIPDSEGRISNVVDANNDGVDDRIANTTPALQDTDGDGVPDYRDADDDGDGVPTRNEDYNNNGNWVDDDTNNNGIPAYLDPEETGVGDTCSELRPCVLFENEIVFNPSKANPPKFGEQDLRISIVSTAITSQIETCYILILIPTFTTQPTNATATISIN
jgi:hypothetical protein